VCINFYSSSVVIMSFCNFHLIKVKNKMRILHFIVVTETHTSFNTVCGGKPPLHVHKDRKTSLDDGCAEARFVLDAAATEYVLQSAQRR
jgi:hypothetical protein